MAGIGAADLILDLIERGDALKPFAGDGRAVAFEDLTQLAPRMRPAMGDSERSATLARRLGEPVVAGWGPRGQRLIGKAPHGHWRTLTFLAALRADRIEAPIASYCLPTAPTSILSNRPSPS